MFPHVFPPPPGYELPQLSLWFCLFSVLFVTVSMLAAICVAAFQLESQRKAMSSGLAGQSGAPS
jgi:hypothetical protein